MARGWMMARGPMVIRWVPVREAVGSMRQVGWRVVGGLGGREWVVVVVVDIFLWGERGGWGGWSWWEELGLGHVW